MLLCVQQLSDFRHSQFVANVNYFFRVHTKSKHNYHSGYWECFKVQANPINPTTVEPQKSALV